MDSIIEYLEDCCSGARAIDDEETQLRIARAIAAYEADLDMEIFTEEFMKKYYSKEG